MDQPVRFHGWRKRKAHAERPELNRHDRRGLCSTTGACHYREWKLSAREEACLMAADGNEIRLRKNLEQVLGLHQTQRGADIEIRPEQEQVQQIAHADLLIT